MKLKNCVKETKTKKLRQGKKQIFLKEWNKKLFQGKKLNKCAKERDLKMVKRKLRPALHYKCFAHLLLKQMQQLNNHNACPVVGEENYGNGREGK